MRDKRLVELSSKSTQEMAGEGGRKIVFSS
jgi:hypothetical protein